MKPEKDKSRIVLDGTQQDPSTRDDIYSPTAHMTAFRLLMAKAADRNWELYSDDASQAFLNALRKASKPLFAFYPNGIEHKTGNCLEVLRMIYGLHDSPIAWLLKVVKHLCTEQGFVQSKIDRVLFTKIVGREECCVNVHDDFVSTGTPKLLQQFRNALYAKFPMTGGLVERHYGLRIKRNKHGHILVD